MENLTIYAPILGIIGLLVAGVLYAYVVKQSVGTTKMRELADAISEGAMAFLKREYRILAVFVIAVFILLFVFLDRQTAFAFLGGAICSVLAGYFGMMAATKANVRTSAAANQSGQAKALSVAFSGGAVMGMSVAALGLIGVGVLFYLFGGDPESAKYINGFAMGASSIALFARVGGGIYTKAADVGADLVGKVEAGIPEDDPRNPATIADNVGDNVGDIAGMGADIFESYVGSIIATIAIAATASGPLFSGLRYQFMAFPLLVVMIGIVSSILGIVSMKILEKYSPADALRYCTFIGAAAMLAVTYYAAKSLGLPIGAFWAVLFGCLCGIMIGLVTEYYTSAAPIRKIAEASL
ncbi:MAG: sodium/proton-translocating pyrophosphatase, partial [Pseudomonadota bacterium]|nr:sodium/proton-translocating pyrophosphatase [Pseudomonadota bacterium]